MNMIQILVLWIAGIAMSAIISLTGQKLLAHVAAYKETWETGYPLTLLAGTMWAYICPIVIMGLILMYSVRGMGKKKGRGRK